MSFSLWVVSQKNNSNEIASTYQLPENEAAAILIEDQRLIEAGNELLELFPALESLEDDVVDDSPWSASPVITPYWIHLSIVFSKVNSVFEKAGPIFEKYSLIGYDPQNEKVYK